MVYWDIEFRLSQRNAALFLKALLQCKGHLFDGCKFNYYKDADLVVWRIALPEGQEELFEFATGFTLAKPPKIITS